MKTTLPTGLAIVLISALSTVGASHARSAKGTLKDLRERYNNVETLQANFREIFEWAMTGETVQREGSLIVTHDDRFRIETPEQLLVSDGKTIYRYNRIKEQVIIEQMKDGDGKLLPRNVLLEFADNFDAVSSMELPVDGKPGIRLDLKPENPDEALLSRATVWIIEDGLIVQRLKFTDLNGNTTMYIFSDVQFDKPLDTGMTTFTPPEGVEVFDLR